MDLKQLEYFLHVADCSSFTAAASLLGVAQPSISRQIRLLEVELRHNLFVRNGRGATPTDAGKLLAEHARMILRQTQLARESMSRLHGIATGELMLGIPSSLVKLLSIPLLTGFREHLPGIHVCISDATSTALEESLLRGRLDVAIVYKAVPTPEIASIPLLKEDLLLMMHVSHAQPGDAAPVPLAKVAALPLVLPRRPHEIRMLVERNMASLGCKPNVVFEVDSIPAILHLIAAGEQYTILPSYAVSVYASPRSYVARPIIEPCLSSQLMLATSPKRAGGVNEAALRLMLKVCDAALEPMRAFGALPARASTADSF